MFKKIEKFKDGELLFRWMEFCGGSGGGIRKLNRAGFEFLQKSLTYRRINIISKH